MIDIMSGTDTETGAISNTKKGSKAGVVVAFLCLVVLAAGGSYWVMSHSKPAAPAVDPKASEQAVKDAEVLWSRAAQAHDMTTLFSYYADDATLLPPNGEMTTNKVKLQKAWTDMLTKDVDLSWTSMYVEAAASGDLVYDVGSYTMTTKAKGKGKASSDRGKYLAVWKKQADGSWKAEADTWNSDLLAPVAKK
ncbi:MAG TPA: DUF4440 domain-containing protein [Acidobacteriaceae bacterium]